MLIAHDSHSDTGFVSATSVTWSHTISGSDRTLVVGCHQRITGNLTSCKWNGGASMTLVRKVSGESNTRNQEVFISPNNTEPETGTYNIVVVSPSTTILIPDAESYTGVDTASPLDNDAAVTNTGVQNQAHGLTTVADDCWLVTFARALVTVSAGTGATMRSSDGNNGAMFDSNTSVGSAGTHSITINATSSTNWASVVLSIKPAGGSPAQPSRQGAVMMM